MGEARYQIAVRIAQKLQDAGGRCEIFNPVATDIAVLRRVLRRDRIIIRPRAHLADRAGVELLAVALGRHGGWAAWT